MERLLPMITEYHEQNSDPSTKVLEYLSPKDLQKAIDFQVGEKGTNLKEIIRLIQLVLKYSVRTSHPRFFKQHFTGTDPIGWISELLTALTNTNCHIYTAAPCFSIMEREVITSMSNILGFKTSKVDGIFCPGGTASNITSLMVARDQGFPHVRQKGW